MPSRLRQVSAAPGMDLLNPNLLFGTAWFWTLPEVHRVQREITHSPIYSDGPLEWTGRR